VRDWGHVTSHCATHLISVRREIKLIVADEQDRHKMYQIASLMESLHDEG